MRILNLQLHNFKGIKSFSLDTQGNDVNIFGDNATGKTTLADAFMWLLFNKDSDNRSDFEIKTLGSDGEPEHGLDHSVEAELELADGKRMNLKKVYSEKWTKKRGSATAEFTGHTTDHFVDGVPVQKKEYDTAIADIADEQIFRLLTDPTFFDEQLHWQNRRELLLKVCGDITDAEVIAENKKLEDLPSILKGRKLEDHRKIIFARRTEINRELERVPVRIDEVQRGLPDTSDINELALPSDIAKLRLELKAKQQELAQARAGGQVAEKTMQLRTIEAQIMDLKNKHREALDEKVAEKRMKLVSVQSEIYKLRSDIDAKNRTAQLNDAETKALDEKMETLRNKWRNVSAETYEFTQSEVCPTCGQALPKEQLDEARERALAQFNKSKAEKLENINAEGKRLKDMKVSIEKSLAIVMDELEKAKTYLSEIEQKEVTLKAEIDEIMQGSQPVESTPENARLTKQYEAIQADIQKIETDNSVAVETIQKNIDTLSTAIEALEESVARLKARNSGLQRINDLKAEERKLAAEYEELERQLYLTDEFIRTKVRMLNEKINSKFKITRFKMFKENINGGVEPCCETMYDGVPYTNLNNGARLNVGLDIINTLADHYSFSPPVWLDNAESVTNILPTKGQQIRLIVSGKDKKLRVENTDKKELKEVV